MTKKIIVFDTETEGLNPYTDKILELAWQVYSAEGELLKECNFVGEVEKNAIPEFIQDAQDCDYFVGHNVEFDINFLSVYLPRSLIKKIKNGKICTMTQSTEWFGMETHYGHKPPKLIELHEKLFDKGFLKAHQALADTQACASCFFELLNRRVILL